MMRSLYSGVAGLRTHQTKMDVLGNNIANVNTTSFKSQSITFSDLMYQTTQTASGATETKGGVNARQIGLGAKSGAIATAIESQGATQTTNNPFDIMITGKSFFVVNNGKENLYTRDGSFYVDGAGNLAMQSNGYLVQGWVANENRETGEITINKNGGLSPLQIMSAANSTYSPASTTAGLFSGNIDDNDTNVTSDDGKTITLEFYDNKGYLYTGKFTLKDTGTDHLFALTLDNILDSNNESIGSDLLKEITFGDVESTTRSTTNAAKTGYTFVTDAVAGTVDINADGGDVKYENVKMTGKLADLMSTSSKSYKGILNTTYGIPVSEESKYTANATYKIDTADEGKLIIYDSVNDVDDGKYASASYSYNKVTDKSYYLKNGSLEAYLAPQSPDGKGDIFNETYLTDAFTTTTQAGINVSDLISSNYSFTFDSATDTITFMQTLTQKAETSPVNYKDSVLNTADEAKYFYDDSNNNLKTVLSNWLTAHPDSSLDNGDITFTYMGSPTKTLTLTGKTYVEGNTSADPDTNIFGTGGITVGEYNYFLERSTGPWTIAQLQAVIDDTSGIYNDSDKNVATTLRDELNRILNDPTALPGFINTPENVAAATIVGRNMTGTPGITVAYKGKTAGSSETIGQFKQAVAATSTLNTAVYTKTTSAPAQPIYAYDNTSNLNDKYQKGYALTSNIATFEGGTANQYLDLLNNVFGSDASVSEFLHNQENVTYKINIDATTGEVSISHDIEVTKPRDLSYEISDNGDGTVNYTSTQAYGDVPVKGKIEDLLAAAKGETAGLLQKIYNIGDEDADAFGTDGTYEIITEPGENYGSMKLNIGDHTIQLKFNAANGALVTADGESTGMVTMKFNQSTPGLEAFGFQAAAGNADEAEKAGDVYIDFSAVTNYNTSGSSTIKAVKGDKKSLNTGRAVGEMNGVNISTDGQIFATYSNGQTKLLGQIASAEFANASGLSKNGDNLYSSTLNSGEATIQDITTDGGYMNTGVLEMSNVDLSREFTEMITTQRGFQANSRIITVSDTLLEELTNLKR